MDVQLNVSNCHISLTKKLYISKFEVNVSDALTFPLFLSALQTKTFALLIKHRSVKLKAKITTYSTSNKNYQKDREYMNVYESHVKDEIAAIGI